LAGQRRKKEKLSLTFDIYKIHDFFRRMFGEIGLSGKKGLKQKIYLSRPRINRGEK
jgi:hypothetical protein